MTNTLTSAQNKYWYSAGRGKIYPEELRTSAFGDTLRTVSNDAFTAGARWAIKESGELSPHIAKFIEMMILLGYFDKEDV